MKNNIDIICSMINWTSEAEMKKWWYELGDEKEPITLCDVRRKIEKITISEYNTTDILKAIKNSWWTIVPRNEDWRYDLTYVDINKVIKNITNK